MRCQRKSGTPGACGKKATIIVQAWGGKSWSGRYCSKHSTDIIRIRMRLIKKYNQNVVLRLITDYDKRRK